MSTGKTKSNVERTNFDEHYLNLEGDCGFLYSLVDSPMHTHLDFYEFSLITAGSFINEYRGQRRILNKNTFVFFGLNESHAMMKNHPDSVHFTFFVKRDFFENFCQQHFPLHPEMLSAHYIEEHLSYEQADAITLIFNTIANSIGQDHLELFRFFLYTALFYCFINKQFVTVPNTDKEELSLNTSIYIKDLVYHLNSYDYMQDDIASIYRLFPLSQSTLINQFKKYTGYTIVQYRHIKRMEYAAQMLTVYDCRVTDVAAKIGINSLSYFSKKFKEFFGVLPSDFHQSNNNVKYVKPDTFFQEGT